MIDIPTYKRLGSLEQYVPTILAEFKHLLRAKEVALEWSSRLFNTLNVTQVDPYTIDATYVNTTVRLQLYLGYKDNRVSGRVVCLHMYLVGAKQYCDVLGEFNFDQSGRTDMGIDEQGNVRLMDGHADEIIAVWLNKAMEHGLHASQETKI
ncbi:hypothetical protein LK540_22800 [Massilia sp. IC2-278]|uniref:hypothetical protein n=1 Tax=Massilia sp. IC2-278 TaxID=2887200 RepID=UPI001E523476|nr:hypothetical protein [Massilia sp. IC2-278]MCC2963269.1 hypothetical protein [Massilia sp. IC2-278]